VSHKGGVTRRFLAYSSPSRSPGPAHLAVLNRPGFVRAAPTLPGITRLRPPSAPPPCCDRTAAKVSHLHSNHSASRRTHDLRHSHATTLLLAGVPVHVVAARLGHADPSITLRVYAHVISDQLTEAADIFARAIADTG
jgi:hypothetical protein